jgi:hypothetical protein
MGFFLKLWLNINFGVLWGFRGAVFRDRGESVLHGARGVEAKLWTRGGHMERRRDSLYFVMWGSSILGWYFVFLLIFLFFIVAQFC